MKIFEVTGVTKTSDFRVSKPIESLILCTNKEFTEINLERVKVELERSSGENVVICSDIPLKSLMMLSTYGQPAITKDGDDNIIALMNLTPDLGIFLGDGDELVISMSGLNSAKTYALHGLENPITSQEVNVFRRNLIKANELTKSFDTADFEVMHIDNLANIDEVIMRLDSGHTMKRSAFELKQESIDVDPLLMVVEGGVSYSTDGNGSICYPLLGVSEIEFKTTGTSDVVIWFLDNQI